MAAKNESAKKEKIDIELAKLEADIALERLAIKFKFIYSMTGLVLGLACILTGAALSLAGVFGKTSWTASLLGLSTSLTDATPGVIVFVVGIFMVLITRFRFKKSDRSDENGHSRDVEFEAEAAE